MKRISKIHCTTGLLRTGLVSIAMLTLLTAGAANANPVAAGDDVWSTAPGGAEHNFAPNPIPADFFEPGSDPFLGVVQLQGAGTGCFDTVVRRLQAADPLPVGGAVTIDIEIVSLNLVSVSPIIVTPQNDLWDVDVDLSQIVPQQIGSMEIQHLTVDGGTFDATLNVCPKFTFQRTTPPFDVRVLDLCDDLLVSVLVESEDQDWSHQVKLPLECPNSSPDFTPVGVQIHSGPHPDAQPVEEVPALTRNGVFGAVLALVGTFVVIQRKYIRD